MKIVIVGCTHAGTAAALNARKMNPDATINVYERNDNISFLSCGIALYVGGVIKDSDGLFYCSPDKLKKIGVNTFMEHEVSKIDTKEKTLKVTDLKTGKSFSDNYDKLIFTTGSWPIIPRVEGIDLGNILLSKNFNHSNEIISRAKEAKKITVIGAGYIGVELVEAFNEQGKEVVLIDAMDRIMAKYLDKEFTDIAENSFVSRGVKIATGEFLTGFKGKDEKVTTVITDHGEYETDLVIMCIGFLPNTGLLKGQVDTLRNGAIIVDEFMKTSLKDVFAAGDSCAVKNNITGRYAYMPLATNAVRMGTIAGRNLLGNTTRHMGTQGTSGIKIYENNIASTGLTEEVAKMEGFNVKTVTIDENNRPEFMPTYNNVMLKLVYEEKTRVLLGAQVLSKADMTQLANTLSVCIQNKMTVDDIAFVDFFFQPHFNKPWNTINSAALQTLE